VAETGSMVENLRERENLALTCFLPPLSVSRVSRRQ